VYRCALPVILLFLVAGCKGSTTPTKTSTEPPPKTTPTTGKKPDDVNVNVPDNKLYFDGKVVDDPEKGKTAANWADILMDESDKTASEIGASQLAKIGAPAVPYLAKAMDSKKDHVKLNALQQLLKAGEEGKDWAKKGEKELAPALNKSLKDESRDVKKKTAEVIAVLRFPESVAALRDAAKNPVEDPGVQRKMNDCLKKIDNK
jgi:hypothetical protein